MKFCSNCGNSLEANMKYCSNCGQQILSSENKIDKSYQSLKSNIQNVRKEIQTSQVANDIKTNATKVINEELPRAVNNLFRKIIDILGIIGLVIILMQILRYFITDKVFLFDEAYYNWKTFHSFDSLSFFSIFIAEIMPSLILPFVFIFLSGIKKNWLWNSGILLIILIFIIRGVDSQRLSKFEESEKAYRESIQ